MQEAAGRALGQAVSDDQREQVCTEDSEYAADGGPDQPLQAHQAQAPLEDHDDQADYRPNGGIVVLGKIERPDQVTSNGNESNE